MASITAGFATRHELLHWHCQPGSVRTKSSCVSARCHPYRLRLQNGLARHAEFAWPGTEVLSKGFPCFPLFPCQLALAEARRAGNATASRQPAILPDVPGALPLLDCLRRGPARLWRGWSLMAQCTTLAGQTSLVVCCADRKLQPLKIRGGSMIDPGWLPVRAGAAAKSLPMPS